MDFHTIELFAGVGMLGEGLRAGLAHMGRTARPIAYVEREAYAASVLAARMQEGSLDEAPIWSNVTTFDAHQWAGAVDCVVAGFPCQDLSLAGRRAGLDGNRSGLFFEVTRIARDCGARYLFLENVGGIASATATVVDEEEGELDERAASRVLGELADLGWNAEWVTISASDIGASYGRARWFCWAWREMGHTGWNAGSPQHGQQPQSTGGWAGEPGAAGDGTTVADTCCKGFEGREQPGALHGNRGGAQAHGPTEQLCRPLFAPGPSDPAWPGIIEQWPHLAPALEPSFHGVFDGLAHRMDDCRPQRLKCCGNGVVAAQAGFALVGLVRRMNESIANNQSA